MSKKPHRPYEGWSKQGGPFVATRYKVVTILAAGIILGVFVSYVINATYREILLQRAESFTAGLDYHAIARLKNTQLNDNLVPVSEIKRNLTEMKAVYDDTQFVYIMDKKGDQVRFLADSEPIGSESYSPRGEVYADATPAFIASFANKKPLLEGPVRDEYGMWFSASAPILAADGSLVAVLGVDVPAESYLAITIGGGSAIMLLALLLCFAVYVYDRSRNRKFEAIKFQTELMSIASHELRTPLSGIRWGQEVLLKGKLDETQKSMVDAMYESTLQLQESIEEILQLASIGSGKSRQLVKVPVDLAEVVESTVMVQQLPAKQRRIEVVYADGWKSPIAVEGDASQLRRVFNNLLSNAVKYAADDSRLTISYVKDSGEHMIRIENKGIGVPKDELKHIFDGFYRASNAVKKQVNGTGMGLYLSRVTIEQHGGRLWIESVENKSTTAVVMLPIAVDSASTSS